MFLQAPPGRGLVQLGDGLASETDLAFERDGKPQRQSPWRWFRSGTRPPGRPLRSKNLPELVLVDLELQGEN